jgi:sugar phosphate permease
MNPVSHSLLHTLASCSLSLLQPSYSISFLISGVMSDVVSVRLLFSVGLAASGALLAIFPWMEGHHFLGIVVYCLLGLSQGCGWPSTAKILRQTYRPSELGGPRGIMSTASSLASFLSPLLVTTIITTTGSWQYSFYSFGLVALSLALPISLLSQECLPIQLPTTLSQSQLEIGM